MVLTLTEIRAEETRKKVERRETHYLRKFGMTISDYLARFAQQNGLCAICRRPSPPGRPLFVDHDHRTGRVRGLVCHRCNIVLGTAGDAPDVLHNAAEYLAGRPPVRQATPPPIQKLARTSSRRIKPVNPERPTTLPVFSFFYPCCPRVYPRQTTTRALWWRACPRCHQAWAIERADKGRGFAFYALPAIRRMRRK